MPQATAKKSNPYQLAIRYAAAGSGILLLVILLSHLDLGQLPELAQLILMIPYVSIIGAGTWSVPIAATLGLYNAYLAYKGSPLLLKQRIYLHIAAITQVFILAGSLLWFVQTQMQ